MRKPVHAGSRCLGPHVFGHTTAHVDGSLLLDLCHTRCGHCKHVYHRLSLNLRVDKWLFTVWGGLTGGITAPPRAVRRKTRAAPRPQVGRTTVRPMPSGDWHGRGLHRVAGEQARKVAASAPKRPPTSTPRTTRRQRRAERNSGLV